MINNKGESNIEIELGRGNGVWGFDLFLMT